jgi:adenylate kinase family enzyme
MRRINVVGTSATGKSTFAIKLAERLGVPCVELDELHWEPGWTEAPEAVFRGRVAAATDGGDWVVDGNYSSVRDLVWARADTVVWLDYPLPTILRRFLRRTVRRIARREELWAGNRERLATQFFSRDSLLMWILSTYRRRRREYPRLLAEHPNLSAVPLRSPAEAARWLAGVTPEGS